MKRITLCLLMVIISILAMSIPANAASLGVSPSAIDITMPENNVQDVDFKIYYYEGSLKTTVVGMPININHQEFSIDQDNQEITITLNTIGILPGKYEGYIRFASTGASVALAVNIRAKVTVSLSANVATPPTQNGGGGISTYTSSTDIFGSKSSFRTDYQGKLASDFKQTSPDNAVSIFIPKGTSALDENGKRLSSLMASEAKDAPMPPAGSGFVGIPYAFAPSGATFSPPIEMSWAIPKGVDISSLSVAYYDESSGTWIVLDSVVDNGIIKAFVSHFTVFALLERAEITKPEPTPIPLTEPVPPVVSPTPEPDVSVPTPPTVEPSPQPVPEPEPPIPTPEPPRPEPTTSGFNWWYIVGGVVIVIALILVVRSRRRKV